MSGAALLIIIIIIIIVIIILCVGLSSSSNTNNAAQLEAQRLQNNMAANGRRQQVADVHIRKHCPAQMTMVHTIDSSHSSKSTDVHTVSDASSSD